MPTPRRLLLVDSERVIADTLGIIFGHEGYEVRVAYSGEYAMKLAADWQPDLTISSMILSGINGFDYARRLVALYPQCRVILAAAQVAQFLIDAAGEAGFDFYFYPVDARILVGRVTALLAEADVELPAGKGAAAVE